MVPPPLESPRFVLSLAQEKEPIKRENRFDEECHWSATSSQKPACDYTCRAIKEEVVCFSAEIVVPSERKAPEKRKQAKESSKVSVENSKIVRPSFRVSENSLPERPAAAKDVSTNLVFYDNTWPKDNEPYTKRLTAADMKGKALAYNFGLMKNYKPGEEEEKKRIDVSTELKRFSYPWKISKRLTISDLGHPSRLLVKRCSVETYVPPFLGAARVSDVHSETGLTVIVWDHDTNSLQHLIFKKQRSSSSYVFTEHWNRDFVHRRNSRERDEIVMYWDSFY